MTPKKHPIFPPERLAYREAGHAVVASHFEIPFVHVGLSMSFPTCSVSRFSSLEEYCQVTPGQSADLRKVDQYIEFLLAGTVADLIHSEHHWEIYAKTPRQRRFRARWFSAVWDAADAKVDMAYCAIFSWLPTRWPYDIDKERRQFWKKTRELLERPLMWQAIETVVSRLQDGELMIESDLQEILAGDAD
jgi:hypothetical protein